MLYILMNRKRAHNFSLYINKMMRRFCDVIEDSISLARRRTENPYALLRHQLQLALDLGQIQHSLREEKEKIRGLLEPVEGNPDRLNEEQKNQLEDCYNQIQFNKTWENAHKDVMDGLVWRLAKYDRSLIYSFSEPDGGTGHLALENPSFYKELESLLNSVRTKEGVPILNDLTHCLRFGDVTVFGKNGQFEIEEVKAGSPRSKARIRAEKQNERLQELITFTREGAIERSGETRIIELCDVPIQHYLPEVSGCLKELSASNPSVLKELDTHLYVHLFDPYHITEEAFEDFKKKNEEMQEKWKGEKYIRFDSLGRLGTFFRGAAPLSIFPFDEKTCAKLLTGQVYLETALNFTKLQKKFEAHGWQILNNIFDDPEQFMSLPKEERKKIPIFRIKKDALTTTVPSIFLTRIAYEFLNPATIIEMAEATYRKGPTDRSSETEILMHFTKEYELWK